MTLSLLSAEFLGLSLITALLLAVLVGPARQLAFLSINVFFLWFLLLGPVGTWSTVGFSTLGFVLALIVRRRPRFFTVALVGYAALFVFLRKYSILELWLPDNSLNHALNTIGLSFLFFKIVHVIIEAKNGTLGELNLWMFTNYCLNYTTFISGPIQRYQDYANQWSGREPAIATTMEAHLDALLRVLVGMVKVYVVADRLLPLTEPASSQRLADSIGGVMLNIYAYYFYLYLNFSGYCDIVIGIGSLIGIRPPENFDKPFLARNISDYWFRWHRSLTLWLTDYVFSPLFKWLLTRPQGSKHALISMNLALLSTMLVSGLWHGTTLNFLVWGLAHGVFLILFRTWEGLATRYLGRSWWRAWQANRLARVGGMVVTFHAVALALVFFRFELSQSWPMIVNITQVAWKFDGFDQGTLRKILEGL